MIDYLKGGYFIDFDQILEINASFCQLAKLHGRFIDANNAFHTSR
jgi:hypothetical protein